MRDFYRSRCSSRKSRIVNNSNISTSITGIIRVTMSKVLSNVVSAGTRATKETVGLTGNGNDSGCDLRSSGRCRLRQ